MLRTVDMANDEANVKERDGSEPQNLELKTNNPKLLHNLDYVMLTEFNTRDLLCSVHLNIYIFMVLLQISFNLQICHFPINYLNYIKSTKSYSFRSCIYLFSIAWRKFSVHIFSLH